MKGLIRGLGDVSPHKLPHDLAYRLRKGGVDPAYIRPFLLYLRLEWYLGPIVKRS